MDMTPTEFYTSDYPSYVINFGMYNSAYAKKSADGKTLTWYVTTDPSGQSNTSGIVYYWIAIG